MAENQPPAALTGVVAINGRRLVVYQPTADRKGVPGTKKTGPPSEAPSEASLEATSLGDKENPDPLEVA